MKHRALKFTQEFGVVFDSGAVQAAEMTLPPGDSEGGPGNRHRGAEQWLFVVEGRGEAVVEGERVALAPGTLVLIARGERHQVRNTGDAPLRTLNFYAPPAYDRDGEPLPAGRD